MSNLQEALFAKDNFASRRTTGHNLYDPESLITGREVSLGLTYSNSHRDHLNEEHFIAAVDGTLNPTDIAYIAPRVLN